MEQGVLPGDRVVAINGWWVPPEGHPRLWHMFRRLQFHYLGLDLKAPVQKVQMTWAREGEQAEPAVEPKAEEPVLPASPTSPANTEDVDAMTSAIGTPTEVVHSSDIDVEMKA